MPTKHIVQWGDSLLSIARHYGFGDERPIAEHPDNLELLAGGPITPGDVLTIPDGTLGESAYGTGRGHVVVVDVPPAEFEVRVWIGFSQSNPAAPGDYAEMIQKWFPFGKRPIWQIQATVSLSNGASGTTNPKTGAWVSAPALADGTWTLEISPMAAELSSGPARAEPGRERKLPSKSPANELYQFELRPVSIAVEVLGGRIVNAFVRTLPAPSRPRHAVLYWKNAPNVARDRQVLDVDWKPDFFRRVSPEVRPIAESRENGRIEIIELHHTAGYSPSSGIGTFIAVGGDSGAHFVIDTDGHVVRMCDDKFQVKHAGANLKRKPTWAGMKHINKRSIGIEHVNGMGEYDPQTQVFAGSMYTDAQYEASIDVIRSLISAYGVPLNNVIGHNDVVWKSGCPGWSFEWPRLERAGVALGPIPVSPAHYDEMFGGFFRGPEGQLRALRLHSREKSRVLDGVTTVSVIKRDGNLVVEGLLGHPVVELQALLSKIGYTDDVPLKDGDTVHVQAPKGEFGMTLGFALRQFITHYCTGPRLRPDLWLAYRDSPLVPDDLALDFELAKLLVRVARAVV